MTDAAMKDLMTRLHAALAGVDKADPELMSLVRELDDDIQRLMHPGSPQPSQQSMLDRAASLEARFATEHPRAEQVLREIVEALGRMGV